jgi:hypothetical protein
MMLGLVSALCLVACVLGISYKNRDTAPQQPALGTTADMADMAWLIQHYYQNPAELLDLKQADVSTADIKAQMLKKCNALLFHAGRGQASGSGRPGSGAHADENLRKDLQILMSAYFLLIMQRFCRKQTCSQASAGPQVQLNVCNVSLEQTHILNQQNLILATLEKRAIDAEMACTTLHRELAEAEDNIRHLNAQVASLETERNSVQILAKCAPVWFSAFVSFLNTECKQGPDLRVGSAQLHDTFCRFMSQHAKTVKPPTQRELTAQLVRLGFEYAQVYINGGNARGFRGFTVRQPLALQSS